MVWLYIFCRKFCPGCLEIRNQVGPFCQCLTAVEKVGKIHCHTLFIHICHFTPQTDSVYCGSKNWTYVSLCVIYLWVGFQVLRGYVMLVWSGDGATVLISTFPEWREKWFNKDQWFPMQFMKQGFGGLVVSPSLSSVTQNTKRHGNVFLEDSFPREEFLPSVVLILHTFCAYTLWYIHLCFFPWI